MSSVLQTWLTALAWKQQSILLSGLRGPDHRLCPMIKKVCRWLRRVSQHNADPSKGYMAHSDLPSGNDLEMELEHSPCHFVHHFADALAVVAYHHPDDEARNYAMTIHEYIASEIFHFLPESRETFLYRHRDRLDLPCSPSVG